MVDKTRKLYLNIIDMFGSIRAAHRETGFSRSSFYAWIENNLIPDKSQRILTSLGVDVNLLCKGVCDVIKKSRKKS